MIEVSMDAHDDTITFTTFDPAAALHARQRTFTRNTTAEDIEAVLKPFGGKCRVAFEVGTQAQWLAGIVRPLAAEVLVANPSRMPWLFRDGRKSDRIDSQKIQKLMHLDELPTVHLPRVEISAWRALINHRRTLIKRRTMVKNGLRAILRAFNYRCPHKSLWTKVGQTWLTGLAFDAEREVMLSSLKAELTFLNAQLESVEKQLDATSARYPNVALLRTIPGIGPRTAEAIVAYTDDVKRFAKRKQFACYFGMTPTLDSSGKTERFGHISKRGPSVVRWLLVEAVHQTIRRCSVFRACYDRLCRGRKDRKKKAVVAVGRRLLTIAFAMMRDQKPFDLNRVRPSAAS
jgi:transposase